LLSAGTSVTNARALWAPASTLVRLGPGERATVTAAVSVTAPIDAPAFRVSSPGAVAIDPSSLPARLEPGQSYPLRLLVTMPGTTARAATVQVLRPGGQAVGGSLVIRLAPKG
jgi:hypothetical protein